MVAYPRPSTAFSIPVEVNSARRGVGSNGLPASLSLKFSDPVANDPLGEDLPACLVLNKSALDRLKLKRPVGGAKLLLRGASTSGWLKDGGAGRIAARGDEASIFSYQLSDQFRLLYGPNSGI